MNPVHHVYEMAGISSEDVVAGSLWDYGCLGIWEEERNGAPVLLAFFQEPRDIPIPGKWTTIEQRNWVAEYQATLQPFQIADLIVAPTHSEVTVKAFEHVLWIDPGMAFGSGHHETTSMAIASLARAQLAGKTVLDVGSGSGILALAAEKLGARAAYGVDTDPEAVRVARENAARNNLQAKFALGTLGEVPLKSFYDVIVANLYAELHVELFTQYRNVLPKGGLLAITGILQLKAGLVKNAIPAGFTLSNTHTDGEWVLFELLAV